MKILFGILAILGLISTTSFAQKVNEKKVPAQVKTAFVKNHAAIKNVSWTLEESNYEAEFTLDGKESSELYSPKGMRLETEVEIKVSELPDYVKIKLKDAKIAEAAKITKANGTIVYEAEVNGKDLLFDAKGNRVKL